MSYAAKSTEFFLWQMRLLRVVLFPDIISPRDGTTITSNKLVCLVCRTVNPWKRNSFVDPSKRLASNIDEWSFSAKSCRWIVDFSEVSLTERDRRTSPLNFPLITLRCPYSINTKADLKKNTQRNGIQTMKFIFSMPGNSIWILRMEFRSICSSSSNKPAFSQQLN